MSTGQTRSSAKRARQDSNADSSAASQVEAAQQLFRRARTPQTYDELLSLVTSERSFQEIEAFYTPIFKQLAKIIVGRDDIPVPPEESHGRDFLTLLDPDLESTRGGEAKERMATMALIDYIKAENEKRPQTSHQTYTPSTEVLLAVQTAWKTGYVGDAHRLLQRAINDMCSSSRFDKPYGNFLSIIQGSGTGKSRLMDQLSQSVFAIPIILRPLSDKSGYPLGDYANGEPLVDFFCGFKFKPALYVQRRYLLFLLQAVAFADAWIDEQKASGHTAEDLAAEWYKHIGDPQSKVRTEMYTAAIDMITPLEEFKDILNEDVPFEDTQRKVRTFLTEVSQKIKPEGNGSEPAFIFYFDEAHHLTKATVTPKEVPKRTAYQCLCKAFTYMTRAPVFALFLSTYSRLSESTHPTSARNFWSSRPMSFESAESDDNMHAPFVELPFDVWKERILVTEGDHSSEEICSLKFMARFGRPLFWALLEESQTEDVQALMDYAMRKLELRLEDTTRDKPHDYPLKELIPPLAIRVDLTFESNRDEAVLLEGLLVASSMRTVYSVPQHRQYLRGGYSSEPFVAEAASRSIFKKCQIKVLGTDPKEFKWSKEIIDKIVAVYKHDIPFAISAWLDRGLIDKGQREELVAKILCILAHDISILKNPSLEGTLVKDDISFSKMIPVVDFLRALIPKEDIESVLKAEPGNMRGETLEEAFKDAFVHFTQFVKAGDQLTITDEAVYLLFVRGAAIQGYLNMDQAGLLIPVWISSKENPQPNRWSMTAIFIQVKNRVSHTFIHIDAQKTFKFFSQTQAKVLKERPYITIAMELVVLESQQNSAPTPQAKEQGKEPQTNMSATPSTSNPIPKVAMSPSGVKVSSFELEQELRERPYTYPRYEIRIVGCSKRAYNVVGEFSYSGLFAHKDMLAEHPRTEDEFLKAIRRMKPYWAAQSSFDWANMKNGSRVGAHVIEDQHAEKIMTDDADKSNKVSDGVNVYEFSGKEAETTDG